MMDECQICGKKGPLETHHIKEQKDADENGMIGTHHKNISHNLVNLCHELSYGGAPWQSHDQRIYPKRSRSYFRLRKKINDHKQSIFKYWVRILFNNYGVCNLPPNSRSIRRNVSNIMQSSLSLEMLS